MPPAAVEKLCCCIHEEVSQAYRNVRALCRIAKIHPSMYYKWMKRKDRPCRLNPREEENMLFAFWLVRRCEQLVQNKARIPGYRQMAMLFSKETGIRFGLTRAYRIADRLGIKGTTKKHKKQYSRCTPEMTSENIMRRLFGAKRPNEKWSMDVTEFPDKYGNKWYLAAIIDLHDRCIVGYAISRHNDNTLVFAALDAAMEANPGARPMLQSDRGSQFTSRQFHERLAAYGITHSMSRVKCCADNGPIESLWSIIKSEMSQDPERPIPERISAYIEYYNSKRPQLRLRGKTPEEARCSVLKNGMPEIFPIPRNPRIERYKREHGNFGEKEVTV